MTITYRTSKTTNTEEIRDYINGIIAETPFIRFFRGNPIPSFGIPSKIIGKAERLGFEPRSMEVFENSGRKIVKIHMFNQETEEPTYFCFFYRLKR